MNRNHNEEIKRPERPTINGRNGYRHKRNPSIRTLMNSKRYQQATPQHERMEQIHTLPHGNDINNSEIETNLEPQIQRLESVINRLRIENSHAMSKADTFQSQNNLLQKSLKHSKQQYSLLEQENKKLKNHNKYLQQRINELKSKQIDDDDIMSIYSLKTQITNLEDTHRKGTQRNKKIKQSLETVINDPGLPSYLRNKLVSLLPNFYTTDDNHTPSSHMKLDILSDKHTSPPLSPIAIETPIFENNDTDNTPTNSMLKGIIDILPNASPPLTTTQSASMDKKHKLMQYKRRNIGHKKNDTYSNGYIPKIQIIKPETHLHSKQRHSVSTVSSHSYNTNNSDDIYLFKDSEHSHSITYDDEEKEIELKNALNNLDNIGMNIPINNSKRKPPLSPQSSKKRRPKPPPPPRNNYNHNVTQSDDLSSIAYKIKTIEPNLLHLSQINEDNNRETFNRLRSVSHDVHSPSSTKGIRGSPTKLKHLTLDTRDSEEKQHRPTVNNIPHEKRVLYQRNKAHTAFEFDDNKTHRRSRSHQRFGGYMSGDTSDSDFSIDNENIFEAKRNKFFHMNLGWKSKKKSSKKKKKRRESIKVSKKEERNLTHRRRSTLRINTPPVNTLGQHKSHDDIVHNHKRAHSAQPMERSQKRYSMSAQIGRNRKKQSVSKTKKKKKSSKKNKKNKAKNKHKMDINGFDTLTMSKTSDADAMSDSLNSSLNGAIMNINPLSPAINTNMNMDRNIIDNNNNNMKINHLLSSPESNSMHSHSTHNGNLSAPNIGMTMSVSKPNSPMLNPLKSSKNNNDVVVKDDNDINTISRNLIAGGLMGTQKAKSFSLQLTKNTNKDFYRNKNKNINGNINGKKKTFSREDITKQEPKKPMPINTKTNPRITRMDQIKMNKRFSSNNIAIPKDLRMAMIKTKSENEKDSPIVKKKKIKHQRRSSFSFKSKRKKTDHFEMANLDKPKEQLRGRRGKHSRSMSLRGTKLDKFSFSLSPRGRRESLSKKHKDTSPTERRKKSFHFSSKRYSISGFDGGDMDDNDSIESFDENKVWTLKDIIREMISNATYDTECRLRNALILCHITFTTSVDLFTELRRYFRMSITQMTSNIIYFEDDMDEEYQSGEDRRWYMRLNITQCIIYWMNEYWLQDFHEHKLLQKEIEFFKSDIRSHIQDGNRSKQLLEPLMEMLNKIKTKYGGINPKNLNLPIENKDENKYEKEEETSVVIHDSESDGDDDDDNDTVVINSDDGSWRRKKNTINLMVQQRERRTSINNQQGSKIEISKSTEAQNIIKSYNYEKNKRELENKTAELKKIEYRYPGLFKLDIVIPHNFNIMELDPEDVAVQLTLLDSFVFKKIHARECIQQNWKKKDKALRAANILKMIAQFNDVSKWVQLTILSGKTPRLRKRYIKKCISMATWLMNNGNLSSLCAFYNALTSNNILSLQSSWKLLSKSKRKELGEIKSLFGWKMNKFKEIQQELEPPCIPHIGIILQILFQIDEGKQSKNPINHSINYIKMMMLHEQIYNLQILQSLHYREEPNFLIQKLLIREFKMQSNVDDNQLYKLAKTVADSEKNQKK